eukprot:5371453-Ditylum_brightwellii.AAC.1
MERAIHTYKNHVMSGLATCNPQFPIAEWDQLIEQANLTLNLLCTSRVNPSLLAHAYLFGNHNLNAHHLAPPGCKVVVHKNPINVHLIGIMGQKGGILDPLMNIASA